jgi:hypothetical protein
MKKLSGISSIAHSHHELGAMSFATLANASFIKLTKEGPVRISFWCMI